jgi:hypothetical protein
MEFFHISKNQILYKQTSSLRSKEIEKQSRRMSHLVQENDHATPTT